MIRKVLYAYEKVREWAREYEPAVAATLAAAVFQMLAGLGIVVGDLPDKVDAVLAFVAVLATVVAGGAIRKRAYAPATHRREVRDAYSRGRRS